MSSEVQLLALVADMDGTLLDTEAIARTIWREAALALGFAMTDEIFVLLLGTNQKDSIAILAEVFGPKFSPGPFYEECKRRTRQFVETNGVPVKTGTRELLDWCVARGWPRAVATSSNQSDAELHLGHAGLREYFDAVIGGDLVARGKPHPEIFLRAAQALGVAPEHCLALEDSAHGVRSARAAGMITFMVPDLVQPSDEIRSLAHRIFPSLHEVRKHLQSTCGEAREITS